jgi:Mg2+ and Co2+ transporter CorA
MDGRVRDFHTFMKTRFILQILYKNATQFLQYLRIIDKKSEVIERKLHQSQKNEERLRNRLSRFGVLRARRGLWSLKITLQGFLREFRWNLSAPPISGVSPGSVMKKCWKKVPVFESFYGNIYLK